MKPDHFTDLRNIIERFAHGVPAGEDAAARTAFDRLKAGLNAGTIRAAERDAQGNWQVNQWVKAGILLGFRLGKVVPSPQMVQSRSLTRTPTLFSG
jgi:2,3,4,5-tetrahydropyridine-2-carboxylate N-succinyltransferase